MEKFRDLVKAQGGDERVVDDPENVLPIAKNIFEVKVKRRGFVKRINTEDIGVASILLGAGRIKKDDEIDHSVGLKILKKIGDRVEEGETIALIYYSERSKLEEAVQKVMNAYEIGDEEAKKLPMIYEVIR